MTVTVGKQAIELMEGDTIVDEGTFPRDLYTGVVRNTVVVDRGVQVNLMDGGSYVRPEDHMFAVVKRDA